MAAKRKRAEESLAKILYIENGLSAKDIAQQIGVTEKTIGEWVSTGGWVSLRAAYIGTARENITQLQEQINTVIKGANGRLTASERNEITQLADIIGKLDKQHDLRTYVGVCVELLEFVRPINNQDAQAFGQYINNFLTSKAK